MKRLYSTPRWARFTRRRQRRADKASKRRRTQLHRYHNLAPFVPPPERNLRRATPQNRPVTIVAPTRFSFIHNTEELLRFFGRVEAIMRRGQVPRLDMSGVEYLGPDAVIVLTERTYDLVNRHHTQLLGVRPSNPMIESVLAQSGFYDHVAVQGTKPKAEHGCIFERQSRSVESPKARELIRLATSEIHGIRRRAPWTYRALIECMMNTYQHAAPGQEAKKEDWWASVFCDPESHSARFAFLDTGVGIFRSVQLTRLQRLRRALGLPDNPALLREIMEGKIGSRTGLSYRGKGLPTLHGLAKSGVLKNLTIITNDVRAFVAEDRYERMDMGFSGTFYTWELGE